MEFQLLLKLFGQKIGLTELAPEEDGSCCIAIDKMEVSIKVTGDEKHLLFFAEIGDMPANGENEFIKQLLRANYLFSATEGGTIGVNTENNKIYLQQQEALMLFDADSLETFLETFVSTLEKWKKLIADFEQSTPSVSEPVSAFDSFSRLTL